jgi:hypothetical protein
MSQDYGLTEAVAAAENLLAGTHPTVTKAITVVSGQTLVAGTVLGRITASGKYAAYSDVAVDGTETAVAILGAACDASAADEKSWAYVHGEFKEAALTGIDAAGILDLEARGIYVK